MRVFVTGASGFIGQALVKELIATGHTVTGLARSDQAAAGLLQAGAQAFRGDLEDLDSLSRGAAASEGVIHVGFVHDFSRFKEVCEIDRRAIGALASGLHGTTRPLVVTSGVAIVSPGKVAWEDMAVPSGAHPRAASEEAANAAAATGVRTMVVRLSPSVHGEGDKGFMAFLAAIALEKGFSAYVADGANRWPALHRFDAATLFCNVFEKGMAGARYHGVAEEGVALKSIAEVIGQRLGLPVASIPANKASEHFGWFSHFAALDCPASSVKTQDELGWRPIHPGLIADLNSAAYF